MAPSVLTSPNLSPRLRAAIALQEIRAGKSLTHFCKNHVVLETGDRWDLSRYRLMTDVYSDQSSRVVIKKSAQVGATIYLILRALWGLWCKKYKLGCVMFLPTDSVMSDMSKARIGPIIRNTVPFRNALQHSDVDTVGLKRINGVPLYLRGATSEIQTRSVSADLLIMDECDMLTPQDIERVRKRTLASELREEISASTPSLPSYGIDLLYQQSSQGVWVQRCECGTENDLPAQYPNCLRRDEQGVARFWCAKGHPLIVQWAGWVHKTPSCSERGYHVSRLNFDPPDLLLLEYERSLNKSEFIRQHFGIAYVEREDQLTESDVLGCCGSHPMGRPPFDAETRHYSYYMGVDIGVPNWGVILGPKRTIYWAGPLPEVSDIVNLYNLWKPYLCYMDAMPETHFVRAFCAQRQNAYGVFYSENPIPVSVDDEHKTVRVCRNEQCDRVVSEVRGGEARFPQVEQCTDLIRHFTGTARVLLEDEETGAKRYRWIKLREDHLFHAYLYASLAQGDHTVGPLDWV